MGRQNVSVSTHPSTSSSYPRSNLRSILSIVILLFAFLAYITADIYYWIPSTQTLRVPLGEHFTMRPGETAIIEGTGAMIHLNFLHNRICKAPLFCLWDKFIPNYHFTLQGITTPFSGSGIDDEFNPRFFITANGTNFRINGMFRVETVQSYCNRAPNPPHFCFNAKAAGWNTSPTLIPQDLKD